MPAWPYNTARWKRLRALQLSTEPLCRFCKQQGRDTLATVADHVVPVAKDPELAFDQDNLQSLCAQCHSGAKQRQEKRGRSGGCDADGNPIDGWEA